MNLILLPGNDKKNKMWVDSVESALAADFKRIAIHYYDHWWAGEDGEIEWEAELDKLNATVSDFVPYIIFAKSEGVLLALYGMHEGVLDPEVCVFAGSAVRWGVERGLDMDNWLINYSVPTLFIQNTQDPEISSEELASLLADKNASRYSLKELPGDDQSYDDVAQLKQLIEGFVDL